MIAKSKRHGQSRFERFLVIDDHPLFCEALSMTLQSVLAVQKISTAHTLADALAMIEEGLDPDTILLDLNLPDVNSIDGLCRLRETLPATPVVVISSINDNQVISRVIQAGAIGFIPKNTDAPELQRAFRRIRDGGTYTPSTYSSADAIKTPNESSISGTQYLETLTPQQRRILDLVCEGKLNKQIAHEFSIAESTVKAHITAILRKLNVQNRTQAVVIAKQVHFDDASQSSDTFT